ncbi:MAG: GIY-YIG nuclease family protein [Alphaproteobacteria bacterium]|nr:GIY-YIG nuclease family protein [Alphaproteobacteria bacterium]
MMTNKPHGLLYTGITNELVRRVYEHKEGMVEGFTKKYRLKMLVYYEYTDDVRTAIQREKNLKHWIHEWKVALIRNMNPEWRDLYEDLI